MQITNIRQLLPLLEGKPEFKVLDKGDYQVIDYVYQDSNTFDEPELMECRGIKFDKHGLILARPFAKFFNYGECGSDLPIHRPHTVTLKLDGSMVHPMLIDNKTMYLCTRKGHTDVAKQAERFVLSARDMSYVSFCTAYCKAGWTPIFEYTGPYNRIVLRYDVESLTLVAMRHTVSGEYMDRAKMTELAGARGIPVVRDYGDIKPGELQKFIDNTRKLHELEGFVVYFDQGYIVKIKAEDYVLRHRALDDMGSKKKVVALCAQGFMDDVLPILSQDDAAELKAFNDAFHQEMGHYEFNAENLACLVIDGEMTRKEFALQIVPKMSSPKWMVGVCFGVMDGKDARMMILKAIQKNVDDVATKWRGQ